MGFVRHGCGSLQMALDGMPFNGLGLENNGKGFVQGAWLTSMVEVDLLRTP